MTDETNLAEHLRLDAEARAIRVGKTAGVTESVGFPSDAGEIFEKYVTYRVNFKDLKKIREAWNLFIDAYVAYANSVPGEGRPAKRHSGPNNPALYWRAFPTIQKVVGDDFYRVRARLLIK